MSERPYTLSDFQFHLPEHLLAAHPSEKRDASRLMIIERNSGKITHSRFKDIGNYLNSGDLLVMNNTKVIPARQVAYKEDHLKGAKLSVLLLEEVLEGQIPAWIMLIDPIRKIGLNTNVIFGEGKLSGKVKERISEKEVLVVFPEFSDQAELRDLLFSFGTTPLPPYIKREANESDLDRYQTVYAEKSGALAAPTAGLHFTQDLLGKLRSEGVRQAFLTLHIGMGTFNPIYEEDLSKVQLHEERYEMSEATAEEISKTLAGGNNVVAVGTTSLRTLESIVKNHGKIIPCAENADLFIKPGYDFGLPASLLTNFHTPGSSLLMLLAAYLGYDFMREVYALAIQEEYRFYSYGDAMLILP